MISILENADENTKKEIELMYEKYSALMEHTALNVLKDHGLAEDAVSESIIKIIKKLIN
jgi:DNA-directed RNA polymerase specialized sigma24 family protein